VCICATFRLGLYEGQLCRAAVWVWSESVRQASATSQPDTKRAGPCSRGPLLHAQVQCKQGLCISVLFTVPICRSPLGSRCGPPATGCPSADVMAAGAAAAFGVFPGHVAHRVLRTMLYRTAPRNVCPSSAAACPSGLCQGHLCCCVASAACLSLCGERRGKRPCSVWLRTLHYTAPSAMSSLGLLGSTTVSGYGNWCRFVVRPGTHMLVNCCRHMCVLLGAMHAASMVVCMPSAQVGQLLLSPAFLPTAAAACAHVSGKWCPCHCLSASQQCVRASGGLSCWCC